ncbi:DUF397 domain-containing protein [Streptomyces sp. HNM0574]|uniref:DUF397 domain-containing protein n=1 Tax=Streptomyces sp. HNM0574 TaxID=2714954 RepID=UPI00146A3412|nr:DUF397 domain-containing protein [Streptomyces sp. HNM0574]NLU66075.1 DUF397 domain-containing protein [Streptomyces sp. HNM0574]
MNRIDNIDTQAMKWFKSSHSAGNGGECVEVAMAWRKSSHSAGNGGECVEIAACPGVLHVRDSKVTGGPVLDVAPGAWAEFVAYAARRPGDL